MTAKTPVDTVYVHEACPYCLVGYRVQPQTKTWFGRHDVFECPKCGLEWRRTHKVDESNIPHVVWIPLFEVPSRVSLLSQD